MPIVIDDDKPVKRRGRPPKVPSQAIKARKVEKQDRKTLDTVRGQLAYPQFMPYKYPTLYRFTMIASELFM
jgi:hypothetical protein